MRRAVLGVALLGVLAAVALRVGETAASVASRRATQTTPVATPAACRPRFVENAGQMDASVAFAAVGRDRTVLLGRQSLTLVLRDGARRSAVEVAFEDASAVVPRGEAPTQVVQHYFRGPDAAHPRHARTFDGVRYDAAWPGVDLRFDARPAALEYSLVVAPGADVRSARFRVRGAERVVRDEDGALVVATSAGPVRQSPPVAWQDEDGERAPVEVAFDVGPRGEDGSWTYGFALGAHDASRAVVIDPQVALDAYPSGLQSGDNMDLVALDASGNVYAAGWSSWTGAVPAGKAGFDPTLSGSFDAWVGKFDPFGRLLWATFLGGSGSEFSWEPLTFGLGVDSDGQAVVTGATQSTDFPTTLPNLTASTSGTWVARLSADGATLVHSRVLGEGWRRFALGADGATHLVNVSTSTVPTPTITVGPSSGTTFGSVITLSKTGAVARLVELRRAAEYSYIEVGGIAVGADGAVHIVGNATVPDSLPPAAVTNSYNGGGYDCFVLKLNPAGTSLDYALHLGGSSTDYGSSVVLDASGAALVQGATTSSATTFPRRVNPDSQELGTGFIAKISPDGRAVPFVQGTWQYQRITIDPIGRIWQIGGGPSRWNADCTQVDSNFYNSGVNPSGSLAFRSAREAWYASDLSVVRMTDVSASPPSGLTALVVSPRSIRVFWIPENSNDLSFDVQRALGPDGSFQTIATVNRSSPFFQDTALTPDTFYRYRVIATTPTARSTPTSPVDATTPATIKVVVKRANLANRTELHADTVRIRGSVKYVAGKSAGGFDPTHDGLRLAIAESFGLVVPAGSPGWSTKGTALTWTGSVDAAGTATLTLDFKRKRLVLVADGLDLYGIPSGQVAVTLRAGSDAGSDTVKWRNDLRASVGAKR